MREFLINWWMKFVMIVLFSSSSVKGSDVYMDILKDELFRELEILSKQDPKVYHINYRVDHYKNWTIRADFGNLTTIDHDSSSVLTTDLRVGDKTFDNTHLIKGEADNTRRNSSVIPFENNALAVKQYIWNSTDEVYRKARAEYLAKKNKISVEDEVKYNDFYLGEGEKYYEPAFNYELSKAQSDFLVETLKEASEVFPESTEIMNGLALFRFYIQRKYFVTSEGHEIVQNFFQSQIVLSGSIRSPEGDPVSLYHIFHARIPEELPDKNEVVNKAKEMVSMLYRLKEAPLAEPYSGPAILSARASGVFFHEILGHRVEGHRLKDETDAHTFKLKINKNVLPKTMSVIFDPTVREFEDQMLAGYYTYDDEGSRAKKVTVIENGILKNFLMSNTPVPGLEKSNGHGRAESGLSPISRQSNLFVTTSKPYNEEELRKMLIKDCKKQGKEYGYYFKEVQGGFTMNKRYTPNAFNVTPTEVYRVYVDGREDELVRGVRLIGTPLAMFSSIEAAGDENGIFNGVCGASSGGVPVAAISPAIYVSKVETQKSNQWFSTGPILESPNSLNNIEK